MHNVFAAIVAVFLSTLPLSADEQGDSLLDEIEAVVEASEAASEDGAVPQGFVPDEATMAALQASIRAHYEYRTQGYDHRSRTFEWQYRSSQIIFGVVIGIVLIGLYFSWLQFHAEGMKGTGLSTSLEGSKDGFKISSPVLGVIILVLSLAFFYLYLVHVYPISEVL
jgi:hypothetical protein